MRILLASTNPFAAGGTEAYLRGLIPLLQARGCEVGMLTTVALNPSTTPIAPAGTAAWTFQGRAISAVLEEVKAWRPDVVYAHGMNDSDLDAAVAGCLPTVYYAHNYAGTCISGTRCHAFPEATPCDRTFGPTCLALYLPRRCGGLNPLEGLRLYRRERGRQSAFGLYRAVLAASRHVAGTLARNGVPAERVHLLPCTLAARDAEPPVPRSLSGRILFVGRLTELKGWAHLLQAMPRASAALGRPLTLVVAGDGPDRAKFEKAVNRAGLDFEYFGWAGAERREKEMRAADLMVVPSVWPEPFGLVGVEAACVGLPAVAYAVGGIPDWLLSGVSGESAPGKRPDPRELADAMVRALADAGHWQRLRVGAWETARRFAPDVHLDGLLPILEAAAR